MVFVSPFFFVYVVKSFQQMSGTIDMQDMWDAFVETVERCIFKTEMSRLETFKISLKSFIGSIINKVQLGYPKEFLFILESQSNGKF